MEKPQVYISHHPGESAATADHIRQIFELHNYPVAMTSQALADNRTFSINPQLVSKDNYTVVLLSPAYLHSPGCLSELLAGLQQYPAHHRLYLISAPGTSLATMEERLLLRRYWQQQCEAQELTGSAAGPDSIIRIQKIQKLINTIYTPLSYLQQTALTHLESSDFISLLEHLQKFKARRKTESGEVRGWQDPLEWQIKSGSLPPEIVDLLRLYALLPCDPFPLETLIPLMPGITGSSLKEMAAELEKRGWLAEFDAGYLLSPAAREAVFTFLQPLWENCRTSINRITASLENRGAHEAWYRSFAQSITSHCDQPDMELAALNGAAGKAELKATGLARARSYLQKAREIYTQWHKPVELAATLCLLGKCERFQGKPGQALAPIQEAEQILTKLSEQEPANQTARSWLAGTWYELGAAWQELERPEQALAPYLRACEIYRPLFRDNVLNLDAGIDYYTGASNLGKLYSSRQEYRQALPWYQLALELVEEWNRRFPAEFRNSVNLPQANRNIAQVYAYLGDPGQALEYYLQAERLLQALLAEDPGDDGSRMELAEISGKRGSIYLGLKAATEALDCFHICLDLCLELQKHFRRDPLVKLYLARSYLSLGILYRGRKEEDRSLEYLQPGIDICCELNLAQTENYTLICDLWTEIKVRLNFSGREVVQPGITKQFLLQTITLVRKLHNHTPNKEFSLWIEKLKAQLTTGS